MQPADYSPVHTTRGDALRADEALVGVHRPDVDAVGGRGGERVAGAAEWRPGERVDALQRGGVRGSLGWGLLVWMARGLAAADSGQDEGEGADSSRESCHTRTCGSGSFVLVTILPVDVSRTNTRCSLRRSIIPACTRQTSSLDLYIAIPIPITLAVAASIMPIDYSRLRPNRGQQPVVLREPRRHHFNVVLLEPEPLLQGSDVPHDHVAIEAALRGGQQGARVLVGRCRFGMVGAGGGGME